MEAADLLKCVFSSQVMYSSHPRPTHFLMPPSPAPPPQTDIANHVHAYSFARTGFQWTSYKDGPLMTDAMTDTRW